LNNEYELQNQVELQNMELVRAAVLSISMFNWWILLMKAPGSRLQRRLRQICEALEETGNNGDEKLTSLGQLARLNSLGICCFPMIYVHQETHQFFTDLLHFYSLLF
jgi:hypothetical protein